MQLPERPEPYRGGPEPVRERDELSGVDPWASALLVVLVVVLIVVATLTG